MNESVNQSINQSCDWSFFLKTQNTSLSFEVYRFNRAYIWFGANGVMTSSLLERDIQAQRLRLFRRQLIRNILLIFPRYCHISIQTVSRLSKMPRKWNDYFV